MTTSEICSHFPNRGYQVLQSPTWDARWQMNQFLGVIHDLIVIIDCEHLCMSMRGVKKSHARTTTSAVRGALLNPATRAEAISLITKA